MRAGMHVAPALYARSKTTPRAGERVEGRRLVEPVGGVPDLIVTLLIRHEQDDVRALHPSHGSHEASSSGPDRSCHYAVPPGRSQSHPGRQ